MSRFNMLVKKAAPQPSTLCLEHKLIHEMHDHELLRGRMHRVLNDLAYDLGVAGLALQRGKTNVTAERIDFVLDTIHKELAKLSAGG